MNFPPIFFDLIKGGLRLTSHKRSVNSRLIYYTNLHYRLGKVRAGGGYLGLEGGEGEGEGRGGGEMVGVRDTQGEGHFLLMVFALPMLDFCAKCGLFRKYLDLFLW